MESPNYSPYPRQFYGPPRLRFDVIGESFNYFKQAPTVYMVAAIPALIALVIYFIVSYGGQMAMMEMQRERSPDLTALFASMGVTLVTATLYSIVTYMSVGGIVNAAMKHIRGEIPTLADAFSFSGNGFNALIALIAAGIFSGIAYCFCVLPGILCAGLFCLMFPVAIAEKLGPIAILQRSWEIMTPQLWAAAGFIFVLKLLMGISVYACGVGLLVGVPIYGISIALVYRDLVLIPATPPSEISTSVPPAY